MSKKSPGPPERRIGEWTTVRRSPSETHVEVRQHDKSIMLSREECANLIRWMTLAGFSNIQPGDQWPGIES